MLLKIRVKEEYLCPFVRIGLVYDVHVECFSSARPASSERCWKYGSARRRYSSLPRIFNDITLKHPGSEASSNPVLAPQIRSNDFGAI